MASATLLAAPPRGAWLAERLAAEQDRLALWLPVALGAGVLLYFALPAEPGPAWALAPLPPLLLAILLRPMAPLPAWGLALLAAFLAGVPLGAWHAARQAPPLEIPMRAMEVSGTVLSVELLPEGRRVTLGGARLGAEGATLPRTLRIRLRATDPARPAPGDRLTVRALVRPPGPPSHPGGFDFQRAAFFSGHGGSGFAIAPAAVAAGAAEAPPLAGTRAAIEARVMAVLPGGTGAIAAALLTGSQSGIPPPDMTAMRDSGLAHLLSVSGLHIAIVMGLSFGIARFVLAAVPLAAWWLGTKAWAAVAALVVGGAYTVLTGSQVPMVRSFAMAALVTFGLLLGRRALSLRSLAVAATALLLLRPAELLGPSFQMSFAAVLALIAGWEWARPRLTAFRAGGGWWRIGVVWALGLVATSVLAGLATTPFGLHHFGRLQWYGVLANAVAVPLTSALVMPAGMAAAALMPFGLEWWALVPMGWGVDATLLVARTVAGWPGAATGAAPLPGWGLLMVTAGMLWLALWRTGWRLWGVPLVVAGLASPLAARPPDLMVSGDGRLIALRSEAGVAMQRLSGASALTRDAWLRLWVVREAVALPAEGEALGGLAACRPAGCVLRVAPGGPAVLLLRGVPWPGACEAAALVVSAEPLRGRCRGRPAVDRFDVWRDGPHAAWIGGDGVLVLSDRALRGDRPWVPSRPRPRPAEVPAEVE